MILAKTIKGYGVPGEGGEGKNTTHQLKKLAIKIDDDPSVSPEERAQKEQLLALKSFRDRFDLPIADKELERSVSTSPPTIRPK